MIMRKKLQLLFTLLLALPMGMLAQGTTWTEATQLPLGQEKSGQLSTDRKTEFWKFTFTTDGAAKIVITPGSGLRVQDLRLYYYQSDGSNYWERTSNNFWINPSWYEGELKVPDMAPGTYLLKVTHGEGAAQYTIKVEFTPSTYANNSEVDGWDPRSDEKPCTLPLNHTVQGHLGYGYAKGSEDDEDWYTFTVADDGVANIKIIPESTLRIEDLRLYYFQSDGKNYWERTDHNYWINPSWYEGNLNIPNLAPGTYLVKVKRGQGYGGYELTYTFTANTYANDHEPDGWNPLSDEKPGTLPLNKTMQGHLGYGYQKSSEDNDDFWTFEVKRDGAVNINIKPGENLRIEDLRLYYYQSDGKNYWERKDHNFWINPSWYEGNLNIPNMAPGTYLVKVKRGQGYGGYELTYTLEPQAYKNDAEPNNDWKEGRDNNYLARGQEKQGHLGYGYQKSSEDDVDFYRITVPCDGKVILTYTPTDVNSHLRVDDIRFYYIQSDGSNYWERTSNTYFINPSWYLGTLTVPDVTSGDYLVKVKRGEGYGAYSLKYDFEQDPLPDDGQAENDWKKPTKLAKSKTLSGHLGYGYANGNEDSEDWYEVTMTSTGTLTINIQPGDNLRIDDVRLYYYQDDRSNYWERTKGNFHINPSWYLGSLVTENVEAGDYLIKVHRGEGRGNYRISFNADLTDVEPAKPLEDEPYDPQPGYDDDTPTPDPDDPGSDVIDEFTLWYTLDTGGSVGYKLSEKPQVRLLGAETTVTSSRGVMTFETMKIWKFTLNAGGTTAIEETVSPVQPEAEGSVSRDDDALVFSGCRPGEPVYIYTAGGRVVSQNRIGSDGSLELSLGTLRPGLYIVKAGSVNIKFLKK